MKPPLIFDDGNRAQPGVHALVVGVSSYSHVNGGTSKPTVEPMASLSKSFRQLIGPAGCARDIADFLIERKDKLTRPLRTLRFLVSPGLNETGTAFQGVQAATADNVAKALLDWRRDAQRSNDEVTFFYFAGHGSQLTQKNALLLLSDFLGGANPFDRTIEVNEIYGGMGVSPATPAIAQTQFYFIDACRVSDPLLLSSGTRPFKTCVPWQVFDTGPSGRTVAPIYYAAAPGEPTKTLTVENSTRFGKRLLQCLRGAGAEKTGGSRWVVTLGQLAKALDRLSKQLNLETGSKIDTFITDSYSELATVIHHVDEPPVVPCIFRFDPSDARKGIGLLLRNFTPTPLSFPAELKDPHREDIPADSYRISSIPPGHLEETVPLNPPMIEVQITGKGDVTWR